MTKVNDHTDHFKTLMLNGHSAIESCSGNDKKHGSHFIEESMLILIREGTLKLKHGNVDYDLHKNQVAFLRKNILVEHPSVGQSDDTQEVKFVRVYLKNHIVKEFLKHKKFYISTHGESSPITIENTDIRLQKYLDSLDPYFAEPEKSDDLLTKIKLLELLFNVAQSNNKILTQLMDMRDHFRTNITTTIEENIMNSLSLSQLADLSGRSLSSFRRDFMAIYKVPPSQWVRQKRLEKALELLRNTTMTVTDVCYTLGFENLAHFSPLFKSYFGIPPSRSKLPLLVA